MSWKEIYLAYQNRVKALESENNKLRNQTNMIIKQALKTNSCETCGPLKNEFESFHETLIKFTKGKDNLNMILSNQRASYNKTDLGYQPNKIFISIFHSKKKTNHYFYKCNYYHKFGHLEPFFLLLKIHDLRWFKRDISND